LSFKIGEHFYVRFRNHADYKQYEMSGIVMIGDSCSFSGDTVKPYILLGLPSFLRNILVLSSL
jgi:hypothetical protein